MSSADATVSVPGPFAKTSEAAGTRASAGQAVDALGSSELDVLKPDVARGRECFIPVTSYALVDRLTLQGAWPGGEAKAARRFFRYLDYWRRQQYSSELSDLLQAYEPFSPDSDLLVTRDFSVEERGALQKRVVGQVERILKQANYVRIDPSDVSMILTKESHYGLDLHVDFTAFEECLVYYRGASTRRDQRRRLRKFMRKEEFDIPIFQRLFLLFKLKPFEERVREVMREQKLSHREAEKIVRRLRALLPASVKDDQIYLKLFKNIPRSDIEMIFPNTRVKFRFFDKVKLGLTGGGAFGAGLFGTVGKIVAGGAIVANPVALAGAFATLCGVAFRQTMNFVNQKNRYMVVMAQNLYFHSMADNRGVMIKLADRAAEEDVKEEMLLYSVLVKERAKRSDLRAIDEAIEKYLATSFGVSVDFDLEDALSRLIADGLVTEAADGSLTTLPPRDAALHLDSKWDVFLDNLPDFKPPEGHEVDSGPATTPA